MKFLTEIVSPASFLMAMLALSPMSFAVDLEGQIGFETQYDGGYDSDDLDNEHDQLSFKIEPEATFQLGAGFSVYAHGVLQPVQDPEAGESRYFEDNGFVIEDLFLAYETGRYAVQGGKFTPAFGIGWDATPGIYGSGFAEDGYEFAERVGLAGSVAFGGGADGSHKLTAHGFFLDTSPLSESLGQGRGTTDEEDGGVSNTEDLSSFAVTLDGEDVAGIKGFGYRISYIRQAAGVTETSDEKGVSVALSYSFDLGGGLSLSPLVEYVHFDDFSGVSGQDRDYATVAAITEWRGWNLAIAYVDRDTQTPGAAETEDFDFQISVGYVFDIGVSVDVGWHITNESNIETRQIGALVTYAVEF
jgi:hypothetical protein